MYKEVMLITVIHMDIMTTLHYVNSIIVLGYEMTVYIRDTAYSSAHATAQYTGLQLETINA